MRRIATSVLCLALAASFVGSSAMAQNRRQDDAGRRQEEEAAAKKKRKEEWASPRAPLASLRNAGPCPYVKVLYDAGRYAEFEAGREAMNAVAYTGEIEGLSAGCRYEGADPIEMRVEVLFNLGRGPQAEERRKTYRYWVAVTRRNNSVIAKEYFDLPVTFPAGQDRVMVTDLLEGIVIPRADEKTSGSNFEVLIGFDVTPQMAEFNRDGKRFRVNAGQATAAATTTPSNQNQ
ncbi:Tat pathway signal sequence domain protein [Caulobacter sp. NIBR2454]|uniref:Tat pathway signal sequence domain protein n=1 Tax=Caulobacter sp. NIBR2454 TaxID=3015996 RepID=UPI0022B607E6|nr:Tat pathway signal sequence domain protein [Caulobacter sp. NIBR2454]